MSSGNLNLDESNILWFDKGLTTAQSVMYTALEQKVAGSISGFANILSGDW